MARARGRNYHGIEERAYQRVEFARLRAAALSGLPGVTILQEYRNLPSAFVRIESEQALDAIVQRPDVEAVHENRKLELFLESSLPFIGQEFIGGIGGAGTTIAFLDTGMSYTNPAFGPCAAPGLPLGTCKVVATAETTFINDFNEEDDHVFQHRTLVSGIALGVAPEARLAVVDVNDCVYGTQPNFIQNGIDWVIDHAFELNIVAINMSLGDNGAYTSACPGGIDLQIAAYYGIAPIIAAGNSTFLNGSFRDGIAWPACVDYAISVGAVWESDIGSSGPLRASPYTCTDATTAPDQVACFSQTSPVLSFLAPGNFVTAAGITNSGTSMAAPHVAGAWAVVRSGNPDLTMEEVLAKL
jgi:subtilisin family serine protease